MVSNGQAEAAKMESRTVILPRRLWLIRMLLSLMVAVRFLLLSLRSYQTAKVETEIIGEKTDEGS